MDSKNGKRLYEVAISHGFNIELNEKIIFRNGFPFLLFFIIPN